MANSHPDSSLSRECDFGRGGVSRGGDPGIHSWAKEISTVVYREAGCVSSLEEMGDKPLRKGTSVFLLRGEVSWSSSKEETMYFSI